MINVSVVHVGSVAAAEDGFCFNITDERGRPLLSISYPTKAEAIAARQIMERGLANVLSVTAHG